MSTDINVSVIIPVYNCEKYVSEAIESVLSQTLPAHEIIVVDDASTDSSNEKIRSFGDKIKYIYQQHGGLGAARNNGIKNSSGNYIAFLDSDDIWLPEKLKLQADIFTGTEDIDMAFGYVRQFISPELSPEEKSRISIENEVLAGHFAGTLLIKRSSFLKTGYFETNWHVGEFIDWYAKAMETGLKITTLEEVVLKRRVHNTNMGITEADHRRDYLKIIKASLDRRKEKGTN